MSHGRRMLEAQAQKERTSGTAPDGRLDDGHLRNGARALNDDGTPVRPSRGAPADETGDGGDALLTSPPPRPTVQLGQSRSSSAAAATRPPRLSGVALFAAGGGGGGGGGAASASTALTAAPRVSASRGPEDSATRSPDTSPRRRRSSTGTTAAPATRSRSRTGGSGSGTAPSAAVRYPVSRLNVASAAATAAPLHDERDERSSSSSRRALPAVTTAAALLHRQPPSATAAAPAPRAAPPPAPVTAALGGPLAPVFATAAAAGVAPRPPPLSSSPPYAEMAMPMSPASPPLRAGVSPRMLPLHPTRADGSTAASLSRSRAASTATTTAVGAPTQSPSSQPPFPPTQPDSQVSPYELRQAQPYAMPPTPPSHTTTGAQAVVAGSHAEEPYAAWRSAPPSPLPVTAAAPFGAAPRLSPLPPSRTDTGVSEATAGAVRREEEENGEGRERDGYGGVDDGFHDLDTPLTRMIDARHCPYMNDFSGFHNNGNDCYGCSLLTMLLRSPVFRRALLTSPIIAAARRYEALLTRKTERRVLWMSGYVDTAPSTVGVGGGAKSGQATAPRKRPRPALDADASVAEVCGLPHDSAAQTIDVACTFTAAVQHTLDVVESFGVEELEDSLEVDLETGRVPATLHSALAGLARSQRWREYMTHVINADHTRPAERQRLMELKIHHDNDRVFDGQQYTNGIRLNAVAAAFTGEFFLGDQEDAHELFVAIMAKLEAEAVAFQQRCAEVLARRSAASDGESTADTTSNRGGSAEPAESGGDEAGVRQGAGVVAVPTPPPSSSLSTEVAEVWVNTLVQTRLLNIIRCRTAGCQHEIVTDEIYVNLSLHIPDEAAAAAAVAPAAAPAAAPLAESLPFSPTPAAAAASTFPALPTAVAAPPASATATLMAIVGAPAASEEPEPAPAPAPVSVAQLLRDSMAYEALRDYRCDGCGSTASQFQGGCFYTCPPPVLVLQLKRFATQFVNGAIHIDKNARRVACEDVLIVHALPSAEELLAHHLRRSRFEAGKARGGNGDWKHGGASELATPGFGLDAAGAACYDPESKCFSRELQSAYESGAGSAEARQVWAIRCVYRLRSCVLHLGQSLHYGHYVADFAVDGETSPSSPSLSPPSSDFDGDAEGDCARHSCGCRRRWRRANDERVDVLPDTVVRTRRTGRSDTYLLLYERVAEEWVRCAAAAVLPRPVYESSE